MNAATFRKIRFWLYFGARMNTGFLLMTILRPLFRHCRLGTYKDIDIASASFNRTNDAEFFKRTVEALQMIESADDRRFSRIQREIRFIVNCELTTGASYRRVGRVCNVDFRRFDFKRDAEWYRHCYASTLVHEATHGAVYSHHIAYTRGTRSDIERLCHLEERRFTTRFDTPEWRWSEQIIRPFDERKWHSSWYSGVFRRAIRLRRRVVHVRRQA